MTELRPEHTRAIPVQVPFVDLRAQYRAIKDDVLAALSGAIEGMELFLGPNVRAFEAEFASFCRSRFACGVGSGTDALYLALKACGVGPGDEVITVPYSFFATAEAICLLGAVPVFIDVDPDTCTMDPSRLRAAIGRRTRAIVPVHLRIVGSLRVSETLAGEVLSLPMFPELEPPQIASVVACLRESLRD